MTDRKTTCVACKSAITKGDIAHSDLEFGGVLKATNQPAYTSDADTDLVATVGTLDEYAPMVRLSDYQIIDGVKIYDGIPGATNTRNSNVDITTPPDSDIIIGQWTALDKNNTEIIKIIGVVASDGSSYANILARNRDGTYKAVRLITSD